MTCFFEWDTFNCIRATCKSLLLRISSGKQSIVPSSSVFGEHIAMVTSFCVLEFPRRVITLASVCRTALFYRLRKPGTTEQEFRETSFIASAIILNDLFNEHRALLHSSILLRLLRFVLHTGWVNRLEQPVSKDGYGHDMHYSRVRFFLPYLTIFIYFYNISIKKFIFSKQI